MNANSRDKAVVYLSAAVAGCRQALKWLGEDGEPAAAEQVRTMMGHLDMIKEALRNDGQHCTRPDNHDGIHQ